MKKTRPPSAAGKNPHSIASVAVTAIIVLLFIANLAVIFAFSAENGEESGNRSAGITDVVVHILHPDFDDLPDAEADRILTSTHHFVRKAAHFCEFTLLGLLATGLLLWLSRHFVRITPWKTWLFPAAFTLLYAISDEVHQIFTSRGARVTDVLLDFSGALFGILLMQGLAWLLRRLRAGKDRAKKSTRRNPPCETPATD